MLNSINTTSRILRTAVLALAFAGVAHTASAQDKFEAKITRTAGASIEADYAAMQDQAKRYCRREALNTEHRVAGITFRTAYINSCVDEIMGNVVSQIQDKKLLAYHRAVKSGTTQVVTNTTDK